MPLEAWVRGDPAYQRLRERVEEAVEGQRGLQVQFARTVPIHPQIVYEVIRNRRTSRPLLQRLADWLSLDSTGSAIPEETHADSIP